MRRSPQDPAAVRQDQRRAREQLQMRRNSGAILQHQRIRRDGKALPSSRQRLLYRFFDSNIVKIQPANPDFHHFPSVSAEKHLTFSGDRDII